MTDAVFDRDGAAGRASSTKRLDTTSDAAVARIKARYRAERRFKFYGVAAISFAALFLVVLLADIILKALPALTQARLVLDVPVTAEHVDSAKPAAGDFDAAIRASLRAAFPALTTRGERKALDSILSSGSADVLRERVTSGAATVGSTVRVPVLLSSDADLYLKGTTTKTLKIPGEGTLTPSAVGGPVVISASAAAFSQDMAIIKTAMQQTALRLQDQVGRISLLLVSTEADLKSATERLQAATQAGDNPLMQRLANDIATFTSTRDALMAQRDAAQTTLTGINERAAQEGSAEILDTRMPSLLVAINGGIIKATKLEANRIEGDVLVPLQSLELAKAGDWSKILLQTAEDSRKITDKQVAFLVMLKEKGAVETVLNTGFFTGGDSREPELAGILGALVGSLFTMFVTLMLCLPIGVLAAIYLEEFAPKNRLSQLVEVNINNLAAVPSIVFGLLGLAVFLNFFGMPRSSPLVGGLVLALLVLPTIIIASRAALRAVPPSIREAALGVGASKQQAVFHHVLPLAMPGILTGTIIGMAHALGETAPLLMIGMIAFIVDVPGQVTEAATVLPVQIFLWSDLPELGFQAKTAAAILVLLAFLLVMNGLAIWLRKKFERRW
jgi:phosphate transport system permease protein